MYVVHCKKKHFDVYIGRENSFNGLSASKWQNPFVIGKDGTRSVVITKYKEYLLNNEELMNSLHELEGKILGCWCKPQACHGDILVELVNKQLKSKKYLEF